MCLSWRFTWTGSPSASRWFDRKGRQRGRCRVQRAAKGDVGGSSPPTPEPGPMGPWTHPWSVGKCRSWAAGEAGLRRAKRAGNRQKGRWESSLSHRPFCLFPCPGACILSSPAWRTLFGFRLLTVAIRDARGAPLAAGYRGRGGPCPVALRAPVQSIFSQLRLQS